VYEGWVGSDGNSRTKNFIIITFLSLFILIALLLISAPLWGLWLGLGLDIYVHDQYFVVPVASTLIFLLLVFAAVLFLIVLVRQEIRRKRLG